MLQKYFDWFLQFTVGLQSYKDNCVWSGADLHMFQCLSGLGFKAGSLNSRRTLRKKGLMAPAPALAT